MSVTHHELRCLRDEALDARAHGDHQDALIYNASVEVDSLGEHIIGLRRHAVPECVVQALLGLARDLLASNAREAGCERALIGGLDGLATVTHLSERRGLTLTARPGTLKQLAAEVRAAQDDGSIQALIARTPRARLTSRSLCHELGRSRGERLMAALGGAPHLTAEPVAA